jgi:lipopolysaccharide export system permease protein
MPQKYYFVAKGIGPRYIFLAMFKLSRIEFYIFKQLALAALLITLSLTAIVWLSQSLRFVDFIINRGLGLWTFLHLAFLTLPNMLPVILPFAVFTAVLFVYNRLGSDSELAAMRAGGLSPRSLSRPALMFALLVTLFSYSLTIYFGPAAYTAFRDLQFRLRSDFSMTLLEEGVFTS